MKIAMMVRAFIPAPAPNDIAYSPLGVAVAIAEGLQERGHEVTFFGPSGTTVHTAVETCNVRPLATTAHELYELASTSDLVQDYLPNLYDSFMARQMFQRANAGEFDALFFHHPESAEALAPLFPNVPVLYTLHDYLDEKRRQAMEMHTSGNQHFISISNSQRRDAPDLAYADTVYNGINIINFEYSDSAEDYLMFAGRIVPEKGVKEAVQVALLTGKRLIITGQVPPTSQWYFDEHVKPHLSDKILFLGLIDKEQLAKYYQKAQALLMPIQWEEPFGLTMAEAMSCGTPVIAFRRGSVAEVLIDGKTGFIVDNTHEMVEAVAKIDSISRSACRTHVEKNFTIDHMLDGYEKALEQITHTPPVSPRRKHSMRKFGPLLRRMAR